MRHSEWLTARADIDRKISAIDVAPASRDGGHEGGARIAHGCDDAQSRLIHAGAVGRAAVAKKLARNPYLLGTAEIGIIEAVVKMIGRQMSADDDR